MNDCNNIWEIYRAGFSNLPKKIVTESQVDNLSVFDRDDDSSDFATNMKWVENQAASFFRLLDELDKIKPGTVSLNSDIHNYMFNDLQNTIGKYFFRWATEMKSEVDHPEIIDDYVKMFRSEYPEILTGGE